MRHLSSNRRRGVTLTEVLIAIFVLALGLLGVLSLFPLGVVRMAQAVKDDRSALANHNATTQFRLYWKDQLGLVPPLQQNPTMAPNRIRDYFFSAMLDPNAPYLPPLGVVPPVYQSQPGQALPFTQPIPFYYSMPSYPILIDGIGFNNPNNQATSATVLGRRRSRLHSTPQLRDVDFTWVPPSNKCRDSTCAQPVSTGVHESLFHSNGRHRLWQRRHADRRGRKPNRLR